MHTNAESGSACQSQGLISNDTVRELTCRQHSRTSKTLICMVLKRCRPAVEAAAAGQSVSESSKQDEGLKSDLQTTHTRQGRLESRGPSAMFGDLQDGRDELSYMRPTAASLGQ